MQERTLRVLEFTKIREKLAALALTPMGAARCLSLEPASDQTAITRALDETEEAQMVLTYMGGSPLTAFGDVRPSLTMANKGGTLPPKALLDVASCLRAARAARSSLVNDRGNTPLLTGHASELQVFKQLEQDITTAIISEEEISDHASPELADIRRHIRLANDRIRDKLNSIIHSSTFSKYLQEDIVTVRNGRYVIPVKQEFRQSIPGLVHDQSATGATLFVEPLAAVELGNEIRQWEAKEKAEIERILGMLSADVGTHSAAIASNTDILIHLDFSFAKGRLAREMRAVLPKINASGRIWLVRVRHPLIDPEKVVPCDLWMGEDFTTLVITGPNTGGKTVTLKTVGLLTLMAQAGLHVPGNLGTELSVFEQVYADIGDEQSIEQSLSTFSSHMTNIAGIMREVTGRDLALFDELGAGTDPTEGAALAQSILDHLLKIKVCTIATTHYSELKAYALSTRGVENASVEFDVATLRPTFRLSIGVPGKSNAFEISRRLGLMPELIDVARKLLDQDTVRFEDVIANAEYHRQIAEKERVLAETARAETVRMRDEAEALFRQMEEKRATSVQKAKEEARRIVNQAKIEMESCLAEARRIKKDGAPDTEINTIKKRVQDIMDGLSEGIQASGQTHASQPPTVSPGDTVDILNLNTRGIVLSAPDQRGDVQLQAGIMKLKVHISQLRSVAGEAQKKKSTVYTDTGAASRTVRMECDVRGMALDEALPEVERYLDEAVMAGLNEVFVIHGKGTGVLRTGIQRHLKTYPHVKSFRAGQYGEGENGVTVVKLR